MIHDYPPSDWPEMSVRVEEAQRRIRDGLGLLRIPAHWGDADLVLGDLARENAALRKEVEDLKRNPRYVEVAALRKKVEACEAEHPPEREYVEWCEAGKPDVTALRKRVEELEAHRSVKMGLALEIERDRAMLRAELAEARVREYDEKLSTEMPKDMKDWWQNSKEEWPEVARWVLENRRKQILMVQRDFDAVANALDKLQAALDKLQADLDAALKWIEGYTDGPSGLGPTSQRVRALLEKRREK